MRKRREQHSFYATPQAPAKTPRAIIDRYNAEITRALENPTVRQKLENIGVQPEPMTTERLNTFIREELETEIEEVKNWTGKHFWREPRR